jgi:hypothetical protein
MEAARTSFDEPLRLVHHHPGRLRVRALAFVGMLETHPALRAAHRAAMTTPGCRRFSHCSATGSIVIEYQPGALDADELLVRIAQQAGLRGVIDDKLDKTHRLELVNVVIDAMKGANKLTHEVSGGRVDLRELLPAGLAIVSLLSFVANKDGKRMPRWDSALWWCQSLFMEWHRREIDSRHGKAESPREASSEEHTDASVPAGAVSSSHHGR